MQVLSVAPGEAAAHLKKLIRASTSCGQIGLTNQNADNKTDGSLNGGATVLKTVGPNTAWGFESLAIRQCVGEGERHPSGL